MALFVVSTPIGNLKDITLRAIEVLRSVDIIAAEDTRVTKKLLSHYDIKNSILSYREQVHNTVSKKIISILKEGKDVALVSDAGTPGISDPGFRLVGEVRKNGIEVISVPGPSAVTAALSISGVNADKFVFLGFPPHKKRRAKFFKGMSEYDIPVVLYESPHRLMKTLRELKPILGDKREILVIKEITKMHEKILRGTVDKLIETLLEVNNLSKVRGEFVLIIGGYK